MELDEFNDKHQAITKKYNVATQENRYFMPTGCLYFGKSSEDTEDEWSVFLVQITGMRIYDGKVQGDPEGYLELLEQELEDIYKFKQ